MVALGFMAGRESAMEREVEGDWIGGRREGGRGERGGKRERKERKRRREREREKMTVVNRRRWVPIRGLYSRGMSYMPPAVADALFIARLFIISSSYTYVAEPALETRSLARRGDGVCARLSWRESLLIFFSPFERK